MLERKPINAKNIARRIESIKKKAGEKKDGWDITKIILSALIPIAIGYTGYIFSKAIKSAEIQSNEKIWKAQEAISRTNASVRQANMLSIFMDALTSDDELKKKIAIKGILIAMPEAGKGIVEILSKHGESKQTKEFAKESLNLQMEILIREIFSDERGIRRSATARLINVWSDEDSLPSKLLNYAEKRLNKKFGIINSLAILESHNINNLRKNRKKIEDFLIKSKQKHKDSKYVNNYANMIEKHLELKISTS